MVITLTSGQKEIAALLAGNKADYAIATTAKGENIIVCHAGKNGMFVNADVIDYVNSGYKVVCCYPALVVGAYDGMIWNTRTSFSLFGNRLTVNAG